MVGQLQQMNSVNEKYEKLIGPNISIKDINGIYFTVNERELYSTLCTLDTKVFGVGLNNIVKLIEEYHRRNGPLPMTEESIKEAFEGL